MQKRTRPSIKRTYWVPTDRAKTFHTFCDELPSEWLQYAIVAFMSLSAGTREKLRETRDLPVAEAVKLARTIIEEGALDEYRLKYMRKLPPEKQLELFGKK